MLILIEKSKKQAQIRKIIEQKGTIKVTANFVPNTKYGDKKELEN